MRNQGSRGGKSTAGTKMPIKGTSKSIPSVEPKHTAPGKFNR